MLHSASLQLLHTVFVKNVQILSKIYVKLLQDNLYTHPEKQIEIEV